MLVLNIVCGTKEHCSFSSTSTWAVLSYGWFDCFVINSKSVEYLRLIQKGVQKHREKIQRHALAKHIEACLSDNKFISCVISFCKSFHFVCVYVVVMCCRSTEKTTVRCFYPSWNCFISLVVHICILSSQCDSLPSYTILIYLVLTTSVMECVSGRIGMTVRIWIFCCWFHSCWPPFYSYLTTIQYSRCRIIKQSAPNGSHFSRHHRDDER